MKRFVLTLSVLVALVWPGTAPSFAAPPTSRTCQPTFDTVVGLDAAVSYLESAWDRQLTPEELEMAAAVFDKVDRNEDNTICIKIASVVPAPSDPVPQAIDNRLPA